MPAKATKTCPICCADVHSLMVSPATCTNGHGPDQRACTECWEAYLSKEVEEKAPGDIRCMFCPNTPGTNNVISEEVMKKLAYVATFDRYVLLVARAIDSGDSDRQAGTRRNSNSSRKTTPTNARHAAGPASETRTSATPYPSFNRTIARPTAASSPASSASSPPAPTATIPPTPTKAAPPTTTASSAPPTTSPPKPPQPPPTRPAPTATRSGTTKRDAATRSARTASSASAGGV